MSGAIFEVPVAERAPAELFELLLHRPVIRRVGIVMVDPTSGLVLLEGWTFEGKGSVPGFTPEELVVVHCLWRKGDLEYGEHGLRPSRARVEDDRRQVEAWVGGRPEPRRRPRRTVDPLRLQAQDLRDAARAAPHGRLTHLTRQADKLDAKADMLALVRRRRTKAVLLELRDLATG